MLIGGDASVGLTAVAVGIAKLGEPAVVAAHKEASSYVGTGRALSVAAGRLSYTHALKVCCIPAFGGASHCFAFALQRVCLWSTCIALCCRGPA